jgi:hypothetical protein
MQSLKDFRKIQKVISLIQKSKTINNPHRLLSSYHDYPTKEIRDAKNHLNNIRYSIPKEKKSYLRHITPFFKLNKEGN